MSIRYCVLLLSRFMMSTEQSQCPSLIGAGPQRLGSIEGLNGKMNDIIYHAPVMEPDNIIIFFGGDTQDYLENMLSHRDNKNYSNWNLESTASLLHNKFQKSDIFIVRPSKMYLKTFSCYSNFAKSNDFGIPSHGVSIDALRHLNLLIQNAQEKVDKSIKKTAQAPTTNGSDEVNLPISLIGFSKGCVVLNQLLFSFMALNDSSASEQYSQERTFVKRIKVMYWLDGGHNGMHDTWITNKPILQNYCSFQIKTRVYVTSYQMMSPTRPRLGKEEKQFRETLKIMNNDIERILFFEDKPQSAETHFQILVAFPPCEK